jgi:hypothetical protein
MPYIGKADSFVDRLIDFKAVVSILMLCSILHFNCKWFLYTFSLQGDYGLG